MIVLKFHLGSRNTKFKIIMVNSKERQNKKRERRNFSCRLQAEHQSRLGLILWYLEQDSISKKELVSEFLRHAYYVRALTLADRKGYDTSSLVKDRQYRKEEAVRGIFYFWGLIESLCTAADIAPERVANRLGGGSAESSSKDLKVSELASLMIDKIDEREQSGEAISRNKDNGSVTVEKSDNMNKVSSLFGD